MPTIYTVALNFADAYARLEPAMHQPPYLRPPQAPILAIKPAACRIASGGAILFPAATPTLRMAGTLAVVLGKDACHVSADRALDHVHGLAAAIDVSIREASFFRPAVAQRCRDTFCPIGRITPLADFHGDLGSLGIRIFVNDALRATATTADLRRSVPQLLADITSFMTLSAGDVLLIGEPGNAPEATVGDRVRVEIDGLHTLENPTALEEPSSAEAPAEAA